MNRSKEAKSSQIINFMRDAHFFVERGNRFLHRNDYERALRCYRRAVEQEPDNPEYVCHVASVYAEMGQYQTSNDILFQVHDENNPALADICYYLASNYANLEDYEMAEEMALRYLRLQPHGAYAEEAEELLDYIYFELEFPPRRYLDGHVEAPHVQHDLARQSLEAGRFYEAIELLKGIVSSHSDFIPAWNNLALAYYYTGDLDEAMATIERTLEQEQGNLHTLCNLAVLLSHSNRTAELLELLAQLKKVVPMHHEYIYKLATTMGVLGQHEEAIPLFQQLFRQPFPHEASTYHFAAISAYSVNRSDLAKRWWTKAKQSDPESGIADYYLRLIDNQEELPDDVPIPYYYHHPVDQLPDKLGMASVESYRENSMLRASLLWALQYGKEDVQGMVVQLLAMIGDKEAKATLQHFSQHTSSEELRQTVLHLLNKLEDENETSDAGDNSPSAAKRD